MAIITAMPSKDIVNSLRGVLDYYRWCNLVICRRWPKRPDAIRSDNVIATGQRFKYINQQASVVDPDIYASYLLLANSSKFTWKDWMVRSFIGAPGSISFNPPLT